MTRLNGGAVRRASALCAGVLRDRVDKAWDVPVPGLVLTVADVAAHVAQVCLWYAVDLASGPTETSVVDVSTAPEAPSAQLLGSVEAHASLLAAVIDDPSGGGDQRRGFHPFGTADPAGFAAMACDELLVHGDDVARAFGVEFEPPDDLCRAVLDRLFPWIDGSTPAWPTLRWANGRAALGDTPPPSRWVWHAAPLDEWDGRRPDRWQVS